MNLGEKLTNLRRNVGLSQDQLAEMLNISRQAVSKWELGTAMPDTENIVKLAQVFDVSTDYLLNHSVIEYPDIATQLKRYSHTIALITYTLLMVVFLYSLMMMSRNYARTVTSLIRPLFYYEYSAEVWKRLFARSSFETAVVFTVVSAGVYSAMQLIRRKDGEK